MHKILQKCRLQLYAMNIMCMYLGWEVDTVYTGYLLTDFCCKH